jgi:hypothetical protein
MLKRTSWLTGAVIVLMAVVGCDEKDKIQVYRLIKAPPESASADPSATPTVNTDQQPADKGQAATSIETTAPADWESQSAGNLRLASFLVKGQDGALADVSLVILDGSAGGLLDNVNRWLSQLGQPPMSADQLSQKVQKLTSPALGEIAVVDLEGLPSGADSAKDGRILAAIATEEGKTIFFKIRGNSALVSAQKDAFLRWVSSARPGKDQTTTASTVTQTPGDKPAVHWQVPDGWKTAPAASMRYASFAIAEPNGQTGDVSVVVFPGDGGSDLDNINRWRGQLGLSPVGAEQLKSAVTSLPIRNASLSTVDLAGANNAVLAAWTRRDGRVWFFKLSGPVELVTTEKPNFTKFLQSVQFDP